MGFRQGRALPLPVPRRRAVCVRWCGPCLRGRAPHSGTWVWLYPQVGAKASARLRVTGEMSRAGRMTRALTVLQAFASLALALPSIQAQHGWVGESANFRVLVRHAAGLGEQVALDAANDLESIREQFVLDGLGVPLRADGPVEVLVVASKLDLHALLQEPASARTRGITIRGTDRDLAIVPWHQPPGPRVILAHEYAHQLDDNDWPLWFREGRAVYLARRFLTREGLDASHGLVNLLGRSAWIPWPDLFAARRGDPATEEDHYQAQSWLMVHWLADLHGKVARLRPEHAVRALEEIGNSRLDEALDTHFSLLLETRSPTARELPPVATQARVRSAAEWEIPLYEAIARRELRLLDRAEAELADLLHRFPSVSRVQAAYGAMQLIRGRQDLAERHYGLAVGLGDSRPRTLYRYAVLLLQPGPRPQDRAAKSLTLALRARNATPSEASHQLAVVHGRMLTGDWPGAFEDLGTLSGFPGWQSRVGREAREIQRRHAASIRPGTAPRLVPSPATAPVPVSLPPEPPQWQPRTAASAARAGFRRWPPSGAWLIHGRVAWINCSEGAKTVIVHTSFKRYALRVDPRRPPRLINWPFRDRPLPCDGRGWQVAVAFRKTAGDEGVDGEIVGVRF